MKTSVCEKCNGQIHPKTQTCLHCGYPAWTFTGKWFFYGKEPTRFSGPYQVSRETATSFFFTDEFGRETRKDKRGTFTPSNFYGSREDCVAAIAALFAKSASIGKRLLEEMRSNPAPVIDMSWAEATQDPALTLV